MKYPKEILVKNYFDIHDYYSNIYGENRTIILMQVGSFHECYCTNTNGLDLINPLSTPNLKADLVAV